MKILFKLFFLSLIVTGCGGKVERKKIIGIDVSHYQGDVNWSLIKKSGYSFAYIKVSEGETLTDPRLSENWEGAHQERLKQGGYHVFVPSDKGELQAKNFLSSLKAVQRDYQGFLPPVLDIEAIPKGRLIYAQSEIIHWLIQVEKSIGCKPIIYTSPDNWDSEFLGNFSKYTLWLADYGHNPTLPNHWKTWGFWQYSNVGEVAGIEGKVDLNRFNGDMDKLNNSVCIKW